MRLQKAWMEWALGACGLALGGICTAVGSISSRTVRAQGMIRSPTLGLLQRL